MTTMTTMRDYELFGVLPSCNACGCELDPEADCRHDGYRGSSHAHNGRGSDGLGAHHYVFSVLCESCRESRIAPLRKILDYNSEFEYLECGHKHVTPYNRWGKIRPGSSRRCEKCRVVAPQNFDPFMHVQGTNQVSWREELAVNRFARAQAIYNNDNH